MFESLSILSLQFYHHGCWSSVQSYCCWSSSAAATAATAERAAAKGRQKRWTPRPWIAICSITRMWVHRSPRVRDISPCEFTKRAILLCMSPHEVTDLKAKYNTVQQFKTYLTRTFIHYGISYISLKWVSSDIIRRIQTESINTMPDPVPIVTRWHRKCRLIRTAGQLDGAF